ncbi:MAG: glutamyl-tRNA reductase [Dehalococcoidia bacterium]
MQGGIVQAIGISHRTAPVEAREQLAVGAHELPGLLTALRESYGTGYVLSTCNRTEIYVSDASDRVTTGGLVALLSGVKGVAGGDFADLIYTLEGQNAVRHLFRVACGIDSMVVGEAQILGQVRTAMSAAHNADSIDPTLSKLLHTAIRLGRRARHETSISRYSASVSTLAVRLARKHLGGLEGQRVLVLSAGEAGKLAARTLVDSGVAGLTVVNRSSERAAEVAQLLGGVAVPFSDLVRALSEADIVISSSGSATYLVNKGMAAEALAARDGKPMLFIDIAVPRDIDPRIKALPHVHLFDIDDLQALARDNIREREKEVVKVEAMVEDEVARFASWWNSLDVVPTIAALRQRADQIRRQELARTISRLPSLSDDDRGKLDALTAAMMKKLLHEPIARLRDPERGRQQTAAVRYLFGLDGDEG